MQKPDPEKLQDIVDAAARLFASRPFHEVRLEDIAAAARIGKGTLYVYFESKDALYVHLVRDWFARVVGRVRAELPAAGSNPREQLSVVAGALVEFAFAFPDLFRVMRSGVLKNEDSDLRRLREELSEIIAVIIRDGTRAGVLRDPFPELTAQFVISFVRGAAMYPPEGMTRERLLDHLLHVLLRGIGSEAAA